jgi:antagonist of KipI
MSFHVIDPGLCSLVVDFGRPRSRSLGVPVGGAADRCSLAVGNALLGNPPETAALEMSLVGPTLRADGPCAAVLFGAPFDLTTDRQSLKPGTTFTLAEGEELRIGGTPRGLRAYLCVQGGLQTPLILGSRTSLRPLAMGDLLPYQTGTVGRRSVRVDWSWNAEPFDLRALAGSQADWFPDSDFYERSYTVSPAVNRMGLRLEGTPLVLPPRELVSEPVCPGCVQVTRDGRPIVLGVDGQTIGGYPKIAQVIAADLDKLGQLRPGDTVRFALVSLAEAERLYRHKQQELQAALLRWRTAIGASS